MGTVYIQIAAMLRLLRGKEVVGGMVHQHNLSSQKDAMSFFNSMFDTINRVIDVTEATETSRHIEEQRAEQHQRGIQRRDVDAICTQLSGITFDHKRVALISSVCASGCFWLSAEQATRILRTFDFDSDRRTAAGILTSCLTDRHMAFQMEDAFIFSF